MLAAKWVGSLIREGNVGDMPVIDERTWGTFGAQVSLWVVYLACTLLVPVRFPEETVSEFWWRGGDWALGLKTPTKEETVGAGGLVSKSLDWI